MIWPFKKRESELPFAEFVKTLKPAPCGQQEKHYEWELGGSLPCPICTANEKRREKDRELDRLADKIVERLQRNAGVPVAITENGVARAEAADVLRTTEAQRQLDEVKKLRTAANGVGDTDDAR